MCTLSIITSIAAQNQMKPAIALDKVVQPSLYFKSYVPMFCQRKVTISTLD